ncbi:MAG: DUF1844 domain-containing protein, partial [Calditrichaeota bacterium]|nr:DUF1844 domain-containing protein [Calditrichota bacterium]
MCGVVGSHPKHEIFVIYQVRTVDSTLTIRLVLSENLQEVLSEKRMEINEQVKESILLRRLIITFQTAAMQQLGKITDPFSGKLQRDLEQASISIDTLDMLQKKTKGN